jgi:hypothetical protein
MKTILSLHGLLSSGEHGTAKALNSLKNVTVIAPDIPLDAHEAIALIAELCHRHQPDLIVGNSMGCMFAHQMHGFKKLLINPAFHVSQFMRKELGEHKFLKARADGATSCVFTIPLCDGYDEVEKHQFDGITASDRSGTHALFGGLDTVVHCYDEFCLYYDASNAEYFNGAHQLSEAQKYTILLPKVRRILGV